MITIIRKHRPVLPGELLPPKPPMYHFCVACERQGFARKYVEVLAPNEHQAIHKASRVYPDCSYRLLIPEPVVKYGLAQDHV